MKQFLNLAGNVALSNVSHLQRPYKLTYAVTYRCNSRCLICSIWKNRVFNELTVDEIKTFFTKNTYFNWIDITGGEVFLRPNLLDIIRTVIKTQKNLYFLHIPTNGILTSTIQKNVTSILAMKPHKFVMTFSIDGPPALHDKLRGIKNNWKQTVASYKVIKQMASPRFDCYFGMTLSGYNFQTIEETFRELHREVPALTRNDLHFNIAHHSSHYYGNAKTVLGTTADIAEELRKFNSLKQLRMDGISVLDRVFQGLVPRYMETHKTPIPCKALDSSLFLDPKGTIYPCTMWNVPLGNVRDIDYDLEKFWRSKKAIQIRDVISMKKCVNCWTPCEAYQSILGNLRHVI